MPMIYFISSCFSQMYLLDTTCASEIGFNQPISISILNDLLYEQSYNNCRGSADTSNFNIASYQTANYCEIIGSKTLSDNLSLSTPYTPSPMDHFKYNAYLQNYHGNLFGFAQPSILIMLILFALCTDNFYCKILTYYGRTITSAALIFWLASHSLYVECMLSVWLMIVHVCIAQVSDNCF